MANGQINSSKLAMIQSGDHEVSKLYKKSEVKANVWSMLGQTQQERKLEKFLKKWPEMEKKNTEKNKDEPKKPELRFWSCSLRFSTLRSLESNDSIALLIPYTGTLSATFLMTPVSFDCSWLVSECADKAH
ncbi:hypothetical protein BpHYR1_045004 [Brachionus plicatilis]|uniref:Uncharacterized protein n=1 Tax=Brachionus plicatilis TaxID=10195 RepID=A0A3M7QF18_BRAPC|nr:hypothetical protein BpHYR1_045004 [Brachionus plicatilis]